MLRRILSTAAFLICVSPALAEAQQEDVQAASAAFAEAQRAQLRGDFPRAAELFEIADQAAASPGALRSAIRNREAAGQEARAGTLALRALARYPEDKDTRTFAESTLERLSPRLVRVRVTCDVACALTVDGGTVTPKAAPVNEFFVSGDPHTLEARWSGRDPVTRSLTGVTGQTVVIDIQAPPSRPQPATAPAAPPPAAVISTSEPPPVTRDQPPASAKSGSGISPAVFWIGAGLTVAAAGALTWSSLDTLSAKDDYEQNPTREGYEDGVDRQTRTNVLAGVTAGLGAITLGIGLFATDWGGQASASIGPDHVALSFKGSLP
ncbi:MAG TPA: hypothetical protein VGK73_39000 [Polyangiaceae bacterium]